MDVLSSDLKVRKSLGLKVRNRRHPGRDELYPVSFAHLCPIQFLAFEGDVAKIDPKSVPGLGIDGGKDFWDHDLVSPIRIFEIFEEEFDAGAMRNNRELQRERISAHC